VPDSCAGYLIFIGRFKLAAAGAGGDSLWRWRRGKTVDEPFRGLVFFGGLGVACLCFLSFSLLDGLSQRVSEPPAPRVLDVAGTPGADPRLYLAPDDLDELA